MLAAVGDHTSIEIACLDVTQLVCLIQSNSIELIVFFVSQFLVIVADVSHLIVWDMSQEQFAGTGPVGYSDFMVIFMGP